LLPTMIQAQINPWTPEKINEVAGEVELSLERMPKPQGFDRMQPMGDAWLESWKDGDPLRDLSIATLRDLPQRAESTAVRALAVELLEVFSPT
jgi:hypothetical protein